MSVGGGRVRDWIDASGTSDLLALVERMLDERDEARRERDETRAAFAALREAAVPHVGAEYATDYETRTLRAALSDTAAAAEAWRRETRARALEEAADVADARASECAADYERTGLHADAACEQTATGIAHRLRWRAAALRGGAR